MMDLRRIVDEIIAADPTDAAALLRLLAGRPASDEEMRRAEARVRAKASALVARQIGKTLTVRTQKATGRQSGRTFTGRIVAASLAGIRRRERSVTAIFSVTLEGADRRPGDASSPGVPTRVTAISRIRRADCLHRLGCMILLTGRAGDASMGV